MLKADEVDRQDTISPRVVAALEGPLHVRYIKLGSGGEWADEALATGSIPFKYRGVSHRLCAEGDWEEVRLELATSGRKSNSTSNALREIRAFYELDPCLFFTIANGHLWWTLAEKDVAEVEDDGTSLPARIRQTADGWHNHDLMGVPLRLHDLSSSLTKVSAYRMTLCSIEDEDYLLRRIKGVSNPLFEQASELAFQQAILAERMIKKLHERDFELLVDLIFMRGGWTRTTALGGSQADIDLLVANALTGKLAWVQVKSAANQRVLDDYFERFTKARNAEHLFFACHSFKGKPSLPDDPRVTLWAARELSRQVISLGLFDWLLSRIR